MFEDWERYVCEFWGLTAEAWQREFLRSIGRPPIVITASFLAEVPQYLGHVTKLRRLRHGIYAETASGVPMIVPPRAVR